MTRLSLALAAGVLAFGLAGATLAQPQGVPSTTEVESAAKGKTGLSKEERQRLRKERRAEKKAAAAKLTPEQRATLRAKRQACRAQGKQEGLRGRKFRAYVRMCLRG